MKETASYQPGERKKIVVVEDDPDIRELESFLLAAEGYGVVAVADGESVVPALKRSNADLVLLDLMLPGKDGNAVLEDLQHDPDTAEAPVIVISAYLNQLKPTPQVRRTLSKPFSLTDLLDAVARELEPDGVRGAAAHTGGR